jgi:hypothetical protein
MPCWWALCATILCWRNHASSVMMSEMISLDTVEDLLIIYCRLLFVRIPSRSLATNHSTSEKVWGLFYTSIRCWKHPNYFSLGSGKQRIILFHKYFWPLHDVLLFCCYFVRRYFLLPYNITFEVTFPVILWGNFRVVCQQIKLSIKNIILSCKL